MKARGGEEECLKNRIRRHNGAPATLLNPSRCDHSRMIAARGPESDWRVETSRHDTCTKVETWRSLGTQAYRWDALVTM